MNDRDTQKQEPAVKSPSPAHALAALAACAALLLPMTSRAASPELQLPDFSHLRNNAVDYTDITLDGFLLRIAKHFAAHADQDEEAVSLLSDIKSVRVRAFEFDSEDAYSRADLDAVRKQLSAPGWSALIQQRSRKPHSNVDVYLNTDGDKILGIAVIESEPRSFTIVNVVGSIDIDKFAKLEGELGIPRVSQPE
jgi:hypothetical protein